ncbi:hypothetical protein [Yinghuangia sp. YIM S09857]|uniref:hypothetical protein n=1 Tax=Yinghuangia sp. YIM S09857 TaxID=3436929 RepID=UPI003F531811
MTALHLVDGSALADLAGYLVRLLRYDRAAVVHLRADGAVLGTFGRVPFGGGTSGVVALRTTELADPVRLDATVSAGRLLDALAAVEEGSRGANSGDANSGDATSEDVKSEGAKSEDAGPEDAESGGGKSEGGESEGAQSKGGHPGVGHPDADRSDHPKTTAVVDVPPEVTGPPWTAMLPPRTGWAQLASLPIAGLVREVAEAVGRFRGRTEALAAEERTRAALDRMAEDVWSRALSGVPGTHLPLRAAHAAASLGFLGSVDAGAEATVLSVGGWLRLDAPYGSVSVRRSGGPSLFVPR